MSAQLRPNRLSGGDALCNSFYSDEAEAEVVGILFCLPDLIHKSESNHRFPPSWGAKRRRSYIDAPPELLPLNAKLDYVTSSPTSPLTFSSHTDLDTKQQLAPSECKEDGNEWLKNSGISIECRAQLPRVNESVSCITDCVDVQLLSHCEPLGPKGIPDLNVPAEMEWPPEEHYYVAAAVESRAEAAALARQRRHLIQKSKKATRGAR